jgi:hypothetical protein
VGIIGQPVDYCIGQRWVACSEDGVPVLHRELADDDGRAHLASIIDHFKHILRFDDAGWSQDAVVQHQHPILANAASRRTKRPSSRLSASSVSRHGVPTYSAV